MKKPKVLLIVIVFLSIVNFTSNAQIKGENDFPSHIVTHYTYDPFKTEENPLRGFFPYRDEYDSFPHSLEFFYIPLKDLMNDFDSYTFNDFLEPWLNDIANRKHQAIFRVYLDYPDEPTGIPDFLLNGLTTYPYEEFGGGISPDYTNETLIATLEEFISVLGEQYDGDNRIGFIQIGLLGHWGEWHTYPHEEWFPNETIQNRILYAFTNAFNTTKLVVRYPIADSPLLDIGYHDDSFAYETIGQEDWEFYNQLVSSGETDKWKTQPIGGEVRPEIQKDLWDDNPPADVQDFTTCVNLTHVSWLLDQDQFDAYFSNKKIQRAREAALTMGYQFFVQSAEAVAVNDTLKVEIYMKNTGNAPFYYPLNLSIGINDSFSKIENYTTIYSNIALLPNQLENYTFDLPLTVLDNDSKISFKLESNQVLSPIFFANAEVRTNALLDLRPIIETTEETALKSIVILDLILISLVIIVRKKIVKKCLRATNLSSVLSD